MGQERPLLDSPWDLEEGLNRMHLGQRGVSICQLDGRDAKRPHITAGVVRGVVLLLTGYDLATKTPFKQLTGTVLNYFSSKGKYKSEVGLLETLELSLTHKEHRFI